MKLIGLAKRGGCYEEIAQLIDSHYNEDQAASLNYQEPGSGYSSLHYAVKNRDHQLINLLLKSYADSKVQDAKG